MITSPPPQSIVHTRLTMGANQSGERNHARYHVLSGAQSVTATETFARIVAPMQTKISLALLGLTLSLPSGAVAQDSLEYAVKFVCGKVGLQSRFSIAPGSYFTDINIHNPNRDGLVFQVKFAKDSIGIGGPISPWVKLFLRYDQALNVNCQMIRKSLGTTAFMEGFAVFASRLPLDVVAIYTAAGAGGLVSTEQIVRVGARVSGAAGCVPSSAQPWLSDAVPVTTALHGVWGPNVNDIFAVGFGGRVVHYNGATWALQPTPAGGLFTLSDVWGSSGTDVWATGAPGDTLLHYNGTTWSIVTVSGTHGSTMGVSGNHNYDVFVVGNGGAIIHYDGINWSPQTSGTTNDLMDVFAVRDSNVFAVGRAGTILHWNGSFWAAQASGTTNDLNAVWGSSGQDVYAVGAAGTILHYNGTAWSPMTSGTRAVLNGVWGSSSCNVFVVGFGGTVLHFDGSVWAAEVSGTTEPLMDIWGFAGNRAYTIGGTAGSVTVRKRAL
jgi:hypothetical protein